MSKVRLLNSQKAPAEPYCTVCGTNICAVEICLLEWICWTDCGCETYVPPCTDCRPVE